MRYAEKLFRPFERLHRHEEYSGTGVGLTTVARVITRHGGKIWAEGTPGSGASFFFDLPVPVTTGAPP
jgi:light-regulated signal transduction histidine kinase (bacteriophytochrome)